MTGIASDEIVFPMQACVMSHACLKEISAMRTEGAKTTADRYIRFADSEARGRSPLYERLARAIATDTDALTFLLALPAAKRQPNLLFAAVRSLFGTQPHWPAFRQTLLDHQDPIRDVMLTHATQTNEPARCATLLPVLARLPGPLALIEVGASAGLCLLPDYYRYNYGMGRIGPTADAPVFTCTASPNTPLPDALPHIVWRAGLDLNPLDPANPAHTAWLEALVWPEQTERQERLHAALAIASVHKPRVIPGDMLTADLDALVRQAPRGATLVIFHTAVLAYVTDRHARQGFADRMARLTPVWIANESPGSLPGPLPGSTRQDDGPGRFLLAVNGKPVAWTDPHGASIDWIDDPTQNGVLL